MMNYKVVMTEIFAILVAALIFNLPVVGATDISIFFNGDKKAETVFNTDDLINHEIDFIHDPRDILWKSVKIAVRVNSASLAKEIKKIYLYKCKRLSPENCMQSEPQVFENFIDTELLWSDISERSGSGAYPQVANVIAMVKLEDLGGTVTWVGIWNQIRRTGYNVFDEYSYELNELDLHAKSLDMVQPIKSYIDNYGMVPFEWIAKAVFRGANSLFALGANSGDIDSSPPNFLIATPRTNEISTINKDFYMIFANSSSGITNPLTLNLNPTFTCGDNACDSNLGETPGSCCYDCPCGIGKYCDVDPADPTAGECRDLDQVSLQVVSVSSPKITDCSDTFDVNVSLKVNNPPGTLPSQISSVFTVNGTAYSMTCSGGPPEYWCLVTLNSGVECGSGSYNIGPNEVASTVTYDDGPNSMAITLNTSFSSIIANYDCSCGDNLYCDAGAETCRSEDAITLGITSLTSYLNNYNEGDPMYLTARIFNPPSGLTVISTSAMLNITNGQVSPGAPTCLGPDAEYNYNCTIPFQVVGYSNQNAYTFEPNTLIFTITYKDGAIDKTKTLETSFGPVSIPSQSCGDGVCNMGETQESCCLDCDCPGDDDYCDPVRNCEPVSGVTVNVESVNPTTLYDCDESHLVNVTLKITNPPSTATLDHYFHINSGVPSGWNLDCEDSGYGGIHNCKLSIPQMTGCTPPHYSISNNEVSVTVSFDDGGPESPFFTRITKDVSAPFSDINVVPVYHCGDGTCESSYGEDYGNCCADCPCESSDYCDIVPITQLAEGDPVSPGTCRSKSDIQLVIDIPKEGPIPIGSCEIAGDVPIKAHIKNAPSDMRAEYFYGTINGTPAGRLHCNRAGQSAATPPVTDPSSGPSFDCTMTVPPVHGCYNTYDETLTGNSFGVFISYSNRGITETLSLSKTLPDIHVTQSIDSIYDIMQKARDDMDKIIQRTQNTTKDMADAYEDCVNRATWVAWAMLIATIGTMGFGIIKMTSGVLGNKWSTYQFRDFMRTVSEVGASVMQMMTTICTLVSSRFQLSLIMQQIEMDMVRMQQCVELNQHMLDVGQCEGREESCFNALTSCVNIGNVNNWMSSINNVMRQIQQSTNSMGQSIANIQGGGMYNRGGYNQYGYNDPSYGQSSYQIACQTSRGDDVGNSPCYSKYKDSSGCVDASTQILKSSGGSSRYGGRYCNYEETITMIVGSNSIITSFNTAIPISNIVGNTIGQEIEAKFEISCDNERYDTLKRKYIGTNDCSHTTTTPPTEPNTGYSCAGFTSIAQCCLTCLGEDKTFCDKTPEQDEKCVVSSNECGEASVVVIEEYCPSATVV